MLYSVLREVPGIEQASPSGGCHCRAMFLFIWYMLTVLVPNLLRLQPKAQTLNAGTDSCPPLLDVGPASQPVPNLYWEGSRLYP